MRLTHTIGEINATHPEEYSSELDTSLIQKAQTHIKAEAVEHLQFCSKCQWFHSFLIFVMD